MLPRQVDLTGRCGNGGQILRRARATNLVENLNVSFIQCAFEEHQFVNCSIEVVGSFCANPAQGGGAHHNIATPIYAADADPIDIGSKDTIIASDNEMIPRVIG